MTFEEIFARIGPIEKHIQELIHPYFIVSVRIFADGSGDIAILDYTNENEEMKPKDELELEFSNEADMVNKMDKLLRMAGPLTYEDLDVMVYGDYFDD